MSEVKGMLKTCDRCGESICFGIVRRSLEKH